MAKLGLPQLGPLQHVSFFATGWMDCWYQVPASEPARDIGYNKRHSRLAVAGKTELTWTFLGRISINVVKLSSGRRKSYGTACCVWRTSVSRLRTALRSTR